MAEFTPEQVERMELAKAFQHARSNLVNLGDDVDEYVANVETDEGMFPER